jgi:hypothetical protein
MSSVGFTLPPSSGSHLSLEEVDKRLKEITDFINGRYSVLNFLGFLYTGAMGAGVPVTIKHNLLVVPSGFLVIYKEVNGDVRAVAGSFTKSTVQLVASVAGTYKIIILR